MGLRQTLTEWIQIAKDNLDFGPEFPAAMDAQRLGLPERLAQLQSLLEQTRQASREKDKLIAKLEAAGMIAGNMVLDGPAYFVKKENTLEGPFCTCCFQRNHEVSRMVSVSRPEGTEGPETDWVQCTACRTPFYSERLGQFLNPRPAAAAPVAVPSEGESQAKSAKVRRPRATTRQPKVQQAEPMQAFGDAI